MAGVRCVSIMEIASLILEFIRVLIWPCIVLFILLKYSDIFSGLFKEVEKRIGKAENIKFGIAGQSIELSGTAKELIRESIEKLTTDKEPRTDKQKEEIERTIDRLEGAVERFSDPATDLVGIFLFLNQNRNFDVGTISSRVIYATTEERKPERSPPWILERFDSMLNELVHAELVEQVGDGYKLSSKGVSFFNKIINKRKYSLSRVDLERMKV